MFRSLGNARRGVSLPVDAIGMIASLGCAIHCALTPVLAASLSLLGLGFFAGEGTEVALTILSAVLAVVGMGLGFRRHRSLRAWALLPAGIALLVLGRLAEGSGLGGAGVPCLVVGGLLLAAAHVLNRRLCLACRDISSTASIGNRPRSRREAAGSGVLT